MPPFVTTQDAIGHLGPDSFPIPAGTPVVAIQCGQGPQWAVKGRKLTVALMDAHQPDCHALHVFDATYRFLYLPADFEAVVDLEEASIDDGHRTLWIPVNTAVGGSGTQQPTWIYALDVDSLLTKLSP